MAEVLRRSPSADLCCGRRTCRASCGPPGIERRERLGPFFGLDAQEVIALAGLEELHALAHLRVADDDARLAVRQRARRRRTPRPPPRCRCRRRAAHASRRPRTFGQRLEIENAPCDGPSACMLLTSTMAIRLSSLWLRGRHGRLPGRALVEFAVGEQVVDEAGRLLALQPEAHADGDRTSPCPSEPPVISMPGV